MENQTIIITYQKAKYLQKPEVKQANEKLRYHENSEIKIKYQKAKYQENLGIQREYLKKKYQENPEIHKKYQLVALKAKFWYSENVKKNPVK